jgi:hypothetical protein
MLIYGSMTFGLLGLFSNNHFDNQPLKILILFVKEMVLTTGSSGFTFVKFVNPSANTGFIFSKYAGVIPPVIAGPKKLISNSIKKK